MRGHEKVLGEAGAWGKRASAQQPEGMRRQRRRANDQQDMPEEDLAEILNLLSFQDAARRCDRSCKNR